MYLVVGLGNPGKKYEKTRHNLGFLALNNWPDKNYRLNKKFQAQINKCLVEKTIYAKPETFMNNSGIAVAKISKYYKISPEDIIVIHDDVDLPFGNLRLSQNKSSAGHLGVKSIINSLKTKNFKRIRIGINSESHDNVPTDKFVLQKFSAQELKRLNKIIDEIRQIVKEIISFKPNCK